MKKRTLLRTLVIKDCKKDFGQGVGVIGAQECEYSDPHNRGFKSPMFMATVLDDDDDFINKFVEVRKTVVRQKKKVKKAR